MSHHCHHLAKIQTLQNVYLLSFSLKKYCYWVCNPWKYCNIKFNHGNQKYCNTIVAILKKWKKLQQVWYCNNCSIAIWTSCRRAAATICPRPSPPSVSAEAPRAAEPADGNVAVGSHAQYIPTVTAAAAWCVNAAGSNAAWWHWPFDLESGVRVTCDVGYLGFSVLDLGPVYTTDIRRQTASSLNASAC